MPTHLPQVQAKGGGDRQQRCWKHSEKWGKGQGSPAQPWEGAPKSNSAQLLLSPPQMASPGAEPAMPASSNATQAGASPQLPLHCSSSFMSSQRGSPAGCVSVMAQPELALEAAPVPAQQNSNHRQTDRSQTPPAQPRVQLCTYNFPQQHHILAPHDEDAPRDVPILLAHVDALHSLVQHQVCCSDERDREPPAFHRELWLSSVPVPPGRAPEQRRRWFSPIPRWVLPEAIGTVPTSCPRCHRAGQAASPEPRAEPTRAPRAEGSSEDDGDAGAASSGQGSALG